MLQELAKIFLQNTENQVITLMSLIILAQSFALVYVLRYIANNTVHIRVWKRTVQKLERIKEMSKDIVRILEANN